MNRRAAIKLGVRLSGLAGLGLIVGYEFLPPRHSGTLEPVDTLARRLYTSLDDGQRAETCVSYDHPMRQYHNRGVSGGGRSVLFGFSRPQRGILTDLLYSGLSDEGRRRLPEELGTNFFGVQGMNVLICGDPTNPPYQIILTGIHLNLRLGGKSREGAAFGGPQVYGDQRGNNSAGLPGNVYRGQYLIAQRLLRNLDDGQKKLAVIEKAPVQTQIELQGKHGVFPGIPVAELAPNNKAVARELVESILSTYPTDDVAYARECLEANGGLDALCLSYYQHGEGGAIPEAQVFRLEGPAAVFYFRGFPHVHAFVNIAMDADAPLSSGESLGTNPTWLEHAGVKALFETAMRSETGADLSYFNEDSAAGRLRPGLIRSGDIYTLESWGDGTAVVDVRGSNLSPMLVETLSKQGVVPVPDKTYKVATMAYVVSDQKEKLGKIDATRPGALLRDLTVDYLRKHGFASLVL